MKRRAIVAGINESWVDLLSLDEVEQAHDKACGGGTCGSTGCGCRVSGRPFRAAVPERLPIRAGDTVEVTASASRALGASIFVFGVPIAAAFGGWRLAGLWFPGNTGGIGAAGAALGFILAVVLILSGGRLRNRENLPEITAVLS